MMQPLIKRLGFNGPLMAIGLLTLIPVFDVLSFHFFNGHLLWMPLSYHAFFAAMNHDAEKTLNVCVILCSIMLGLPIKRSIIRYLAFVILLISWYKLFFQMIHYAEKNMLSKRASPSLVFGVYTDLRVFANPGMIKIYASSSFPSGHAMILGFWHQMARSLFIKPWRQIVMTLSILMCLPRLIAGAHWLSDVVVGFALGSAAFICFRAIQKHSQVLSEF
jgi:membrane-associated phospholipid phosphatase